MRVRAILVGADRPPALLGLLAVVGGALALAAGAAAGRLEDGVVLSPANPNLPTATVGKSVAYTFQATYQGKPYTYGMFGCKVAIEGRSDLPTFDDCGKLPPGLTMRTTAGCTNVDHGCLSLDGTPTKAGTYTFRIAASDGLGGLIVREYTLIVQPAAPPPKKPDVSVSIHGPATIHWFDHFAPPPAPNFIRTALQSLRYEIVVTNHGPGPVTGVYVTTSFWDAGNDPVTVWDIGGGIHRDTDNRRTLAARGSFTVRFDVSLVSKSDLDRPNGTLSEPVFRRLIERGALVVKAQVKVAEKERDNTNNRATKESVFKETK